jgi:hypothetical protein
MFFGRSLLLAAILPTILVSAHPSLGAEASPWDGAWNGKLGKAHPWPISVTISNGKVVSFSEGGAPFDIRYTQVTPTTISFGDQNHYSMKLTRTGDATASARVYGRHGYETGSLTKG